MATNRLGLWHRFFESRVIVWKSSVLCQRCLVAAAQLDKKALQSLAGSTFLHLCEVLSMMDNYLIDFTLKNAGIRGVKPPRSYI